ncbi:hypothetical protein ACHQM5_010196 [Ranunculus cassubicifolius]
MAPDSTMYRKAPNSRKGDLVFVVNPKGANGRTGKEWKKLLPYVRSRLGKDLNVRVLFVILFDLFGLCSSAMVVL